MSTDQREPTIGEQLAWSFRPFINPKCIEIDEIVKDIAKAIDNQIAKHDKTLLIARVKQTLSALDFDKLTDFQAKCILLLSEEANKK